jgi:hypothetical protein
MIKLKTSEKVTRNLTMIEDTMDTVLKKPFIDFYDYYILLKKVTIQNKNGLSSGNVGRNTNR